jgi:hypothetical protein
LTCAYTANGAPAQTPHLHDRSHLLAFAPQSTVTQVPWHCSSTAAQQHNETCYSRLSLITQHVWFALVELHCSFRNALWLSCFDCTPVSGHRPTQLLQHSPGFVLPQSCHACSLRLCVCVWHSCASYTRHTTNTAKASRQSRVAHGCWPRPAAQASRCMSAAVWHYSIVIEARGVHISRGSLDICTLFARSSAYIKASHGLQLPAAAACSCIQQHFCCFCSDLACAVNEH